MPRASASQCLEDETVAAFLTGLLTGAQLRHVEAHVGVCNECVELIATAARGLRTAPSSDPAQTGGRVDAHAGKEATLVLGLAGVAESSLRLLLDWLRGGTAPARQAACREMHEALLHSASNTRFRLEERLGGGGMGTVYRAHDRVLGHFVALKVMQGFSGDDRRRWKAEFRSLTHIRHPNLITLYDLIVREPLAFITMELVSGRDFVAYHGDGAQQVARAREISYERLRDTARQLASALDQVHSAHKLHRDVKPSNVLVTDAGRVVLLDFGLVWQLSQEPVEWRGDPLAGTPRYMAPEQLAGQPLTPAADWYAFGLTLRQAITGEPPRSLASHGAADLSLRARGFALPEDLDELLVRLLAPAPEARPSAHEILRCLGGERALPGVVAAALPEPRQRLFGREAELRRLGAASADVERGNLRLVRVSGPSGIGKTSLIQHFLADLGRQRRERTLILSSCCHPREALTFNAVDGWIDGLARELPQRLDAAELQADPAGHHALVRVFPVLGRWLRLEDQVEGAAVASDRELRSRAFLALRMILQQLSRRWQLVLWMDDMQWADDDSGELLLELVRASGASLAPPSPPALLIFSYRDEDRTLSPCWNELLGSARPQDNNHNVDVRLGPLDDVTCAELLDARQGDASQRGTPELARLIRETRGSPFLLLELDHWLSSGANSGDLSHVNLDQVLQARTSDLPSAARTLLELLAVAGGPLEQGVALRAAGLNPPDCALIADLERRSILCTSSVEEKTSRVYHDRIRQQVLGKLSHEQTVWYHRAIGQALLTTMAPNPLAAVEHLEAAGDHATVRRYILLAAEHASSALAFDRAAKLYARAIELNADGSTASDLRRRLATALASAGRGQEAAEAFLEAGRLVKSEASADPRESSLLRQKAAEQLLQTGHYEQGLQVLRSLLSELSVPFPRSRWEALLKATAWRLLVLLRGHARRAPARPPNALDLQRFDALWGVGVRFGMVDYALINYVVARSAAGALALDDPIRIARALAAEASLWVTLPGSFAQRRSVRLIDTAQQLCTPESPPYDRALVLAMRGIVNLYQGHFRRSLELTREALQLLRASSSGLQYEHTLWEFSELVALAALGQVDELIGCVRRGSESALGRGDRLSAQSFSLGPATTAWLALDQPQRAAEQADQALSFAPERYTLQHFHHYVSRTEADLYLGQAPTAWERSQRTWRTHGKSFVRWVVFARDHLIQTRAKSAVAMATFLQSSQHKCTPDGHSAAQLRRIALDAASQMAGHGFAGSLGWGLLLRAAVARLENCERDALDQLRQALTVFEQAEMLLYREATRFCLGSLCGGDEGAAQVRQAEAWMRARGIVNPAHMLRVLTPGLVEVGAPAH
ncbi:MAG: protein kinase [Deltaproteobacteria bacterium]